MKRRRFLKRTAALPLMAGAARCAGQHDGNGIQVIYSNDTTHILSNVNPWRQKSEGFTDDHLRASIREAVGVDAHFLQPGLGWIPWWQSRLYSPEAHYRDFLGEHGVTKLPPIARYLLAGGDLVRTHVEECRAMGVRPFVSFRLNDGHHVRGLAEALTVGKPSHDMSRHYWANYQNWRLGPDHKSWDDGVFDWAIPEVREHKLSLIRELCADYDLDGLELDFLRHWHRFHPKRTTAGVRERITTEFVAEVREALGQSPGRELCLRVPARLDLHASQGVNLPALAEAGATMVNLSYSYFTVQDDAARKARELLPRTSIYIEMTHTTMTGKALGGSGTQPYLRTTAEQFYSTTRLARHQGATGVSVFNFPYYRDHVSPALGPFTEPPFEVLGRLKDEAFLAEQRPWWFTTQCRRDPVLGERVLPLVLTSGKPGAIPLWTSGAAVGEGILRLRFDGDLGTTEIAVTLNDHPVAPCDYVAKPLPHPYDAWLGGAGQYRCYACPAGIVADGRNLVEAVSGTAKVPRLIAIDLTFP